MTTKKPQSILREASHQIIAGGSAGKFTSSLWKDWFRTDADGFQTARAALSKCFQATGGIWRRPREWLFPHKARVDFIFAYASTTEQHVSTVRHPTQTCARGSKIILTPLPKGSFDMSTYWVIGAQCMPVSDAESVWRHAHAGPWTFSVVKVTFHCSSK